MLSAEVIRLDEPSQDRFFNCVEGRQHGSLNVSLVSCYSDPSFHRSRNVMQHWHLICTIVGKFEAKQLADSLDVGVN